MAGGQQIAVEQGSLDGSRDIPLVGSQADFAAGTIVYSIEAYEALLGSESVLSAGDVGSARLVPLRSRKIGGGAAFAALTGQQITSVNGILDRLVGPQLIGIPLSVGQGVFGKQRSNSLTGSAATVSAGTVGTSSQQEVTWNGAQPHVINVPAFTLGTAGSYALTLQTTNYSVPLHDIQLDSALPAGYSIDADGLISYSGGGSVGNASRTATIVDAVDADWVSRSSGAVLATRLDTAGAVSTYTFQDGSLPHVPTLDTTIYPTGGTGSARCNTLNTDSTVGSMMRIPFGTAYADGATFWVSYRVRATSAFAFQPWPTPDQTGQKLSIISNTIGSNQNNELVMQGTHMSAQLNGYYQDGNVTAIHTDQGFSSAGNAGDFRQCASIDRASLANSGAFSTYPLTGTNPDTGAAWSTWEQERARYGLMYSAYSTPSVPDFRRGLGDPITGGFRLYPDEFITITTRMIVGNFGQFNNRWTVWAARADQPYVKLWDLQNIRVGSSATYNALWLVPYVSSRTSGGRKVSARTSNITGCTIHTCGLTTPIGDGTLSYNASTQRFTWASFGESAGTVRGFSVANGKTRLNVISSGGGNNYLVIEVNAGLLPSSGTVNDTVTIANGRQDVYCNYADVIVSTSAINAPGGYAPVG